METKPITDTPRRIVFWASHPGAPRNPSSSYNKRQPPEDQVKADHCCRDVAIVELPPELANQMGDSLMMEWLDVITGTASWTGATVTSESPLYRVIRVR